MGANGGDQRIEKKETGNYERRKVLEAKHRAKGYRKTHTNS